MSDLVKRLRKALWVEGENELPDTELANEAADEIERLREKVFRLEEVATDQHVTIHGLKQEVIEDMRAWAATQTLETDYHQLISDIDAYAKDRGIE